MSAWTRVAQIIKQTLTKDNNKVTVLSRRHNEGIMGPYAHSDFMLSLCRNLSYTVGHVSSSPLLSATMCWVH